MEKKKILVIGATGMLGHMVYYYLSETGQYTMANAVYRNKLTDDSIICDVRVPAALEALFQQTQPDVVINCVGALVQQSKDDPEAAIYLNALLPHKLKSLCDMHQAKLIHISTDCVFSGKKGHYAEDDFRDADDVYGMSKTLGEILNDPKHVTLRTSIIGPELKENGTGLLHWFLNEKGAVKGFTKAIWSGVTTLELAKAILAIIENDQNGLKQVTNGSPITKYQLLHLFQEHFSTSVSRIMLFEEYEVDKSLYPSEDMPIAIGSYKDMLSELRNWMVKHPDLYVQYQQ